MYRHPTFLRAALSIEHTFTCTSVQNGTLFNNL